MKSLAAIASACCWFATIVGCSGPGKFAPPPVSTTTVESGPLLGESTRSDPERAPFDRSPLDTAAMGWIVGFRSEIVEPGGSTGVAAGRSWRSGLRLLNGTHLLVATSETPEIRFPDGFALPLGQILRDIPEAWRSASVVTTAGSGVGATRIRSSIEFVPASDTAAGKALERLYVFALPVVDDPSPAADGTVARASEGDLVSDPNAHWSVPPGASVKSRKHSYVVPVDSTVHFGIAVVHQRATQVRLTDLTDSKLLWEAKIGPTSSGTRSVDVFRSETGFPVYREHEYEVEVRSQNPGSEPVDGTAVVYLYYSPPNDEEFSYPFPPEDDAP